MQHESRLVSIVITCFNQARFLAESIESALAQTYPHLELIVIDDGSTDDTHSVASKYRSVQYIFQPNSGLPSARNAGLKVARGDYIVFLDADDRLLTHAVETNAEVLNRRSESSFVSGHYRFTNQDGSQTTDVEYQPVIQPYYQALLRGNYIGMHATVLYRRERLVSVGGFSPSLRACEDYEVYLRLARDTSVERHSRVIAEYRQHNANMSSDHTLMLDSALEVLRREKRRLPVGSPIQRTVRDGMINWQLHYGRKMRDEAIRQVRRGHVKNAANQFVKLITLMPRTLVLLSLNRTSVVCSRIAECVRNASDCQSELQRR